MRFETPILLTEAEYNVMTEHGVLCNDEGEIDQECFQVPCCAHVFEELHGGCPTPRMELLV